MSKDYNYEIGYETLQSEWKIQCKRTPRGVTLVKGGNNIYLQFKTPNTNRSKHKCACSFSIDGMHEAVRKSFLVKARLKSLTSETEFWEWYKKEIEEESRLVDDRITFGEAIKKIEDDFWSRPDRRGRERDKANPSDQSSWYRTYGCFYKHLSSEHPISLEDIQKIINKQKRGTKNYKYVVSAMKKLVRLNKRNDILEELETLNVVQTKFMELQSVDIDVFLKWRNKIIGECSSLCDSKEIENRKAWMWVFSVQIVYALRISEVFAIKNLTKSYVTKDGEVIPALNDPTNTDNLIYIGDRTVLGTTTKTGSRLARPNIPPKYPDLLNILDIKDASLPSDRPTSKKASTVTYFFPNTARKRLLKWNAPFTQTHADRTLGNINGMQAGIPLEVRAMSLGHTPAQNDSGYKKRLGTKTKIDLLLNSNSNAIDFVTALAEAKKLIAEDESNRDIVVRMLSIVYQKNAEEIYNLF